MGDEGKGGGDQSRKLRSSGVPYIKAMLQEGVIQILARS